MGEERLLIGLDALLLLLSPLSLEYLLLILIDLLSLSLLPKDLLLTGLGDDPLDLDLLGHVLLELDLLLPADDNDLVRLGSVLSESLLLKNLILLLSLTGS